MPYKFTKPISVFNIAKSLNCELPISNNYNPNCLINSIERIDYAGNKDITFCRQKISKAILKNCKASACFISKINVPYLASSTIAILSDNPEYDFCNLINTLLLIEETSNNNDCFEQSGYNCFISRSAKLHESVQLGPNVIIESGCNIQKNTKILANSIIRKNTKIGENCKIGSHVSLANCIIGSDCVIEDSVIIGSDGFGFIKHKKGILRKPHLAIVEISDKVEIGSATIIDRGFLDNTVIGYGTKIDSQVKVGHGVKIGSFCIIAGQTGLAGSCTLGNGCTLAGQVGIADHINIGNNSVVLAKSGVMSHIQNNEKFFGIPARNSNDYFRGLSKIYPSIRNKK